MKYLLQHTTTKEYTAKDEHRYKKDSPFDFTYNIEEARVFNSFEEAKEEKDCSEKIVELTKEMS